MIKVISRGQQLMYAINIHDRSSIEYSAGMLICYIISLIKHCYTYMNEYNLVLCHWIAGIN